MIDGLRAHYEQRRPGWRLLDAAGRARERLQYQRTLRRATRRAAGCSAAGSMAAPRVRPVDRRPRVLVCDRHVPTPDRDAGSARMAWILRLLAEQCSHVTFVPQRRFAFPEYATALREIGVEVILGDGRPLQRVLETRAGTYDVVVLSRAEVASGCIAAVRRHQPRARVVFDTVELTSTRLQRQRSVVGGGVGNVVRERALEDHVTRCSDVVALVSEAERRELVRRGFAPRAVVLPLVFTTRTARPGFDERRDLLFVGNFTHPPNADAVRWFATAILPRIRRHIDVTLHVAGPGATAKTRAQWGPQVTYEGWVPDLQTLMDNARVAVAPLRFGAGVKGKVGEALATGLPCVATTVGAEGMDLDDGTHALIADDCDAFAAGVLRAYTDSTTWTSLSNAGLAIAGERWSPLAMSARLAGLLSLTLGDVSSGATAELLSRSSPVVQLSVT